MQAEDRDPVNASAPVPDASSVKAVSPAADTSPLPDNNPWTFNAYYENDLFAGSDQNYTNGIRFSWISPDVSSYEDDPSVPQWFRTANHKLRYFHSLKDNEKMARNFVFSVGQLMYTPENRDATELLKDERPYAGFLYAGMAYNTRSHAQLDTVALRVGVVGPASYAHETQDFVHEVRGFEKFKGWDNQLDNELGLQMVYEQKHRMFYRTLTSALEHDMISHAGFSLGNVATYANFGGEYRLGWELPDDFGTSSVQAGSDNSAPGRSDPRLKKRGLSGVHAFASLDTRLVLHDIFLDGNTFRNGPSVDKEPVVAYAALGVAGTMGSWKVSYAQVFRTREFETQPHAQSYGSISLSHSW